MITPPAAAVDYRRLRQRVTCVQCLEFVESLRSSSPMFELDRTRSVS
jgi:hypothetical protein